MYSVECYVYKNVLLLWKTIKRNSTRLKRFYFVGTQYFNDKENNNTHYYQLNI